MTKEEVAVERAALDQEAQQYQDQHDHYEELEERRELAHRKHLEAILFEQKEEGAVFYRDWNNAPFHAKEKFLNDEFPEFIKKIRNDVLELTLEAMGYAIGVSKNQMARIEAGGSQMSASNMLLMFDQVEKALIRQDKEWYDLGEHEVDNLIPDMYKKLRGWVYGRRMPWPYSLNGELIVENAVPPLLARYPEQSIPGTVPEKFDRVYANYTKEDRTKIKKGELEGITFEMRKYVEDAKVKISTSPKKKPKEVVVSWAVLEKLSEQVPPEHDDPDLMAQYKSAIEVLNRKSERLNKELSKINAGRALITEELDRTKLRMETAEKLVAVYEHQIRHNKAMADQGLTGAILGLPIPPPEKMTVDDVPEDLQEQIFDKMHIVGTVGTNCK